MKPIIIACLRSLAIFVLAVGGLIFISGCTTVEQMEPATRTSTTTEQTTVSRPLPSTVETQTIRSY